MTAREALVAKAKIAAAARVRAAAEAGRLKVAAAEVAVRGGAPPMQTGTGVDPGGGTVLPIIGQLTTVKLLVLLGIATAGVIIIRKRKK